MCERLHFSLTEEKGEVWEITETSITWQRHNSNDDIMIYADVYVDLRDFIAKIN